MRPPRPHFCKSSSRFSSRGARPFQTGPQCSVIGDSARYRNRGGALVGTSGILSLGQGTGPTFLASEYTVPVAPLFASGAIKFFLDVGPHVHEQLAEFLGH